MKTFENIEVAYIESCKHILNNNGKVVNLIYKIKSFQEKRDKLLTIHLRYFGKYYYNDCIRSLTTHIANTQFEFSYLNRLTKNINQIKLINEKINKNPSTRKLILTTTEPEIDLKNTITPCLILIEFIQLERKLYQKFTDV